MSSAADLKQDLTGLAQQVGALVATISQIEEDTETAKNLDLVQALKDVLETVKAGQKEILNRIDKLEAHVKKELKAIEEKCDRPVYVYPYQPITPWWQQRPWWLQPTWSNTTNPQDGMELKIGDVFPVSISNGTGTWARSSPVTTAKTSLAEC